MQNEKFFSAVSCEEYYPPITERTPEQKLLLALFERAIKDLGKVKDTRTEEEIERHYREAQVWFQCYQPDPKKDPLNCRFVCEALDLDYLAIWNYLKKVGLI